MFINTRFPKEEASRQYRRARTRGMSHQEALAKVSPLFENVIMEATPEYVPDDDYYALLHKQHLLMMYLRKMREGKIPATSDELKAAESAVESVNLDVEKYEESR
jgi:hypothetical protein